MSHSNPWAYPSNASGQDMAAMAASLEERSLALDQQPVNAALINTIAPSPGDRLLEAGCGSGVLCRLLAPEVAPFGRITGLDISPGLISLAQNYAVKAGLADWIDWCSSKAETLPFPDDCFDGALAARLLLHVSKPEVVLKELARVVRPGGRIATMDWDFDTVAVDHSNRELTRRLLHWRCDQVGGNNWSGRQLWKQMADAGLSCLKIVPVVSVAHCEQDSLTVSLFRAAQGAREGGEISPDEYDAWVAELKSALATGSYFASIVYFIVLGER